MIFSPLCSWVPWNSVSAVIVRAMFFTGDVQRSISSIALGSKPVGGQTPLLIGVQQQLLGSAGQRVAGGLVAADQQQQRLGDDLVVLQPLIRRPRRAPGC